MSTRAQIVVVLASEAALYATYTGHDAAFHWFTHLLVGALAALSLMTARTLRTRRPASSPLLQILFWHVVAMLPDLLFIGGIPHQPWMDVFLGHVSSHFVPGRNLTWLGLVAATSAAAAIVQREAQDASTPT
ncbi:hypothetical protein [Euzebya rosea]|uniref:hypothetical protein n=1 Tax=Euzebya rosea TaxID=2052804 RepID=UPI0013002388|nr:hypothetical protein [Euzebya rosea]